MYAIIAAVLVLLALWVAFDFNRLVRWRNMTAEAWSGIDVQLKRRYDLVPNLVEAVRGYSAHEQETFTAIARLRTRAIDAAPAEQTGAENALSGGLRSLLAVAEGYPALRANENFLALQQELVEVEDQIQLARRYYNGSVRNYNTLVQSFPSLVLARLVGFRSAEFFEIERATERSAPEVVL